MTTNNAQNVSLQANQTVEISVSEGQKIDLGHNADIQGVTTAADGTLVVNFADGAKLVIANFAEAAQMSPAPVLVLQDGQTIALGEWADIAQSTIADAEMASLSPVGEINATGLEYNAADKQAVVIGKPQAGEDMVVRLDAGENYQFDFAMNEPSAVKENGGQLVISFADGGTIIIPNYGDVKTQNTQISMKDGAEISITEFGDVLAMATQLNQIEAAAGESAGAAAGRAGGFGFGSTFQYTPFSSLDPIGEINPTALAYGITERQDENGHAKPVPNLETGDTFIYEDGSGQIEIYATPNNGNEQITITISGIDGTWAVDTTNSGGTYDPAAGTWTITLNPGQSFGESPIFAPPADSDADMPNLTVTSSVTNTATGLTGESSVTVNIFTDAVADVPELTVAPATGDEDTTISLDITTAPKDKDGSEIISKVVIDGVPDGVTLSAGTNLGNGAWQLTPDELVGLTLTPPQDYSGTFTLTVTSTAEEVNFDGVEFDYTNNEASRTAYIDVNVNAVADKPNLTVKDAQVKEDQSVALEIEASLNDTDGSERLTVTIEGFQPGWVVDTTTSGGTYDSATGVWTLTLPQNVNSFSGGPTVYPPANSDVDLKGLKVTATAVENSNNASASVDDTLDIIVDAVIDAPVLDVTDATGNEDAAIALDILADVGDKDGSETVAKVVIEGVPAGATLSAGTDLGNGTWELTQAQLNNLKITPPSNWSGAFDLTVTSYVQENPKDGEYDTTDNTADITKTLKVTVNAVADKPALTVEHAQVKEDSSVALNISAELGDKDGSELLSVSIAGFKPGWVVDTSISGGTYNEATGVWTLDVPAGTTSFTGGPTVFPPANSDVDLTGLVVTATATESSNGNTNTIQSTLNIIVDAVIDTPTLDVQNASGNEDTAIALNIQTDVGDKDGSETIAKVVITGYPAGTTFSAGKAVGNTWELTQAELAGLKLTPPKNFDGSIKLKITTHAQENPKDGEYDTTDNATTLSKDLTVTVKAVADKPSLTVKDAEVKEDGAVELNVTAKANDPSESLTVTITGIDKDWGVDTSSSGGTYNPATGTWTITVPPGGQVTKGPKLSPPKDSDVDLNNLTVTATAKEPNGSTNSVTGNIDVTVDAVIDTPTLTVKNANTNEDTAVALNITTAAGDTDGSETITKIVITGYPAGTTFSAGKAVGNTWELTPAQLNGLKLNPPKNWDGQIKLKVTTHAAEKVTDGEYDYSDNATTLTKDLTVTVKAVADKPNLTVENAQVKEDGSVALKVNASLNDTDGSERLTVTIGGFEDGWTVSGGGGTYDAATKTWSITLPAGQTSFSGGPTIKPPKDSDVDLKGLTVTATARETSNGSTTTNTGKIDVIVDAVIDKPTLNVNAASGKEGQDIPLVIKTATTDIDGSETITKVVISGLPSGYTLSTGKNLGNGSWELTPAQLNGLKLKVPANGAKNFTLKVTSHAAEKVTDGEYDTSDNATSVSANLKVTIGGVADKPTLKVEDLQVKEDGSVDMKIDAKLTDSSEYLTITVTGIDKNWGVDTSKSGGTYNPNTGTWTLKLQPGQNFNGGPKLSPPKDSDVDMKDLTVSVTSTTTDGVTSAATTGKVDVIVDAVIDAPTLTVQNANTNEDTAVALKITTDVGDKDGSETISKIVISGLPAGATLSAGKNLGNGSYELTKAQLNGLKLNPPKNWDGQIKLKVTTHAQENPKDGEYDTTDNATTLSKNLTVTVNAVADKPNLTVENARVKEDGSVALKVNASLNDTDGSERLTVTIGGFKDGWTVSGGGGTYNAATKTWTITLPAGQTSFSGGPTIKPPKDSDVDLTGLTVTATAREGSNGSTAVNTGKIDVIVDAVADAPNLSAGGGTGQSGTPVNFNISTSVNDTDGSESISSIIVSGLPNGFTLSAGKDIGGGKWELSQNQLNGLKINAPDGYKGAVKLTVTSTAEETKLSGQEYDYTDNTASKSVDVTFNFSAPKDTLIVGTNTGDSGSTGTPHVVPGDGSGKGKITGGGGNDILIGDIGGSTASVQAKDYNFVFILDVSGSMGSGNGSKLEILKASVINLLEDYRDYQGGDIKVHIVPFGTNAMTAGTFTITKDGSGYQQAVNWVNGLTNTNGWTNYEEPMANAINWLNGSAPIKGAETISYFISDGEPNRYMDGNRTVSGNIFRIEDELTGRTDGSNEIGQLKALSKEVIAIGVDLPQNSGAFGILDMIDSNGDAINVKNPNDLNAVLQDSSPIYTLTGVGADTIEGGAGNDLIFGDSINTDVLAQQHSATKDLPPGSGWTVFQKLGWSEAKIMDYIRDNAEQLATESKLGGKTRVGGNDTLYGGDGNDLIFGMEGNDIIWGGNGSDTLWGGSGKDTFVFKKTDTGVDTIKDFSIAEGDILDISDILSGQNVLANNIHDFVKTTHQDGNTVVQVKNGGSFQTVAVLEGVETSVNELFTKSLLDIS